MFKIFALLVVACAASAVPHYNRGKRCASLFDDSCVNPPAGGGGDEWLGGNGAGKRQLVMPQIAMPQMPRRYPGRRCASLFDESCVTPPAGGGGDGWLGENQAGKREVGSESTGIFKHLSDFFNRVHMVASKRCATLFDESCINGGIGNGDGWLGNNGAGKR